MRNVPPKLPAIVTPNFISANADGDAFTELSLRTSLSSWILTICMRTG